MKQRSANAHRRFTRTYACILPAPVLPHESTNVECEKSMLRVKAPC